MRLKKFIDELEAIKKGNTERERNLLNELMIAREKLGELWEEKTEVFDEFEIDEHIQESYCHIDPIIFDNICWPSVIAECIERDYIIIEIDDRIYYVCKKENF